ncbi:hypothetical protein JR316_0001071 [Psilocybe cubensis]|uniref:Uncharacterized protein n=1 Tax=Psilocybe cubensis TaxID=181762 RepID=A0ACB8HH25_PSICU|nr:hypothetical protein JR316_0001071 [Psilocybe cubensis]KAH9487005.1 hypothetical protein JR316_0001071 [Psilocybe cubensis]
MVKVGPRLPPPTRRELARQEKEAKRAEQLANGIDPALLGEPREHLALLIAKKTRSKRLEPSVLEQSWKKWEKNQKRAHARRLAKSLKENINSEGSQDYGDTSQSASSITNESNQDPKVETIRGDSVDARLPDMNSTASEMHGILVSSPACPLGPVSSELSSLSLTGTSLSLSSSECRGVLDPGSSTSLLPYASNTPLLGVQISTGDFWPDKNAAPSNLLDDMKEANESAKIKDITHLQGTPERGKCTDPPTVSSQCPLNTLSRVSSLRKSRTVMNAALAPPRLTSRKGSASSFIFSEPLDSSKFSSKSSVSASINTQRGESSVVGGSESVTPTVESIRGLNLTPRARVSAYVRPRCPVLDADQTILAESRGRDRDVNDKDTTKLTTWQPPVPPSNDTRPGIENTFGTIAAPASLAKQVTKNAYNNHNDVLNVGILSGGISQHTNRYAASTPEVTSALEPKPIQDRVLKELSNNAPTDQAELQPNTYQSNTQTPIVNEIKPKLGSSCSNVINEGSSSVQTMDQPNVVGAGGEPVGPDTSRTPAVLAPAACIVQDKKPKPIKKDEVVETQRSQRRSFFNIQPVLRSMLRPAARDNGSEQPTASGKYPDTPLSSWSGIVPPVPTPATRSPLIFAMGLPSPPWSRSNVLPRHVADTNPEAGTSRGFVFGTPRNVSIPSSAYNDGKGSFSYQLPFDNQTQLAIMMSDSTGFNAGGVSELQSVRPSNGRSCNTTEPTLQQCRPYLIEAYTQAVQPVTIYVIVPGGSVTTLKPPTGPTSFTWNANAARGTSMMFMLVDAQGRQGGSSDIIPVGVSDDTSCLNASSPSTTSNPPFSTSTSSSSPSSTSGSKSGISIAAVAGTVIGALIFLSVTVTLGLFFLRRKQEKANLGFSDNKPSRPPRMGSGTDLPYDSNHGSGVLHSGGILPSNLPPLSPYPYSPNSSIPQSSNPFLDSHSGGPNTASSHNLLLPSGQYQPSPFDASSEYLPRPPHIQGYLDQSPLEPNKSSSPSKPPGIEPETYLMQTRPPSSIPETISTSRKAALAAAASNQRPTRFIVHTDVEDDIPPPNADGIVELPPQYSERRGAPSSAIHPPEQAGPPPGTYPL